MRYFTATHEKLEWPLPDFMEPVSTVPAGDGVTDLGDRFPELAGRGPELGEYATLFGVRRVLQESWRRDGPPKAEEMVGTSHYRRFAVTRPIGTPTFIFRGVTPESFAELADDLFLPPPGTVVIPPMYDFGASVLQVYSQNHSVRDLLHFMGLAVDLGVVDDREMAAFLHGSSMVATPSVSVVPATWFADTLEGIERVVDAFESTVAVPRDGYQRRAVGFCCERVHALLLVRLLSGWQPETVIMNPSLIVSPDGTYQVGT